LYITETDNNLFEPPLTSANWHYT